jgi:HEAT repeat protein
VAASEVELVRRLEDPSTRLEDRRRLLGELRTCGTDRAVPVLRRHLRHPDLRCQVAAVLSLARIDGEEATEALGDAMTLEPGPPFTFAVRELGTRGGHRARELLVEMLERRGAQLDSGGRRVAIGALSRMPHVSEVGVLASALHDPNARTRRAAAVVLGRIRAPESRAALATACEGMGWWRARPIRRALRSHRE